jgi:type I restriction enzyme M protein
MLKELLTTVEGNRKARCRTCLHVNETHCTRKRGDDPEDAVTGDKVRRNKVVTCLGTPFPVSGANEVGIGGGGLGIASTLVFAMRSDIIQAEDQPFVEEMLSDRLRPFYEIDPAEWKLSSTLRPEVERVRQWMLRELLETYHFPPDWIGSRILCFDTQASSLPHSAECGITIDTLSREPFLCVSVAAPGGYRLAEEHLKAALLRSHTAGVGIATDGSVDGTRFLRRRFDREQCEYLSDIEPYVPLSSTQSAQIRYRGPVSSNGAPPSLSPLTERCENVFFEAHSHIRDIDGLHADEALDELCKLLYLKLYDEETTAEQQSYRAQKGKYGTGEEFAATIRGLYAEANRYASRVSRLVAPDSQRSLGVFTAPLRLSGPALVKAVETLQGYDITRSAADIKGRAFQKVLGPAARAGMGQYFTPDPIVRFMVQVAQPTRSDRILDPFCGSAHFLTACRQAVRRTPAEDSGESPDEFACEQFHGIEKSDRMVRIAMTDTRLQGEGHSDIRCADALLDFRNYPDLQPESFDLILTNPPFGSLLGSAAIAQLGTFALAANKKSVPLEVLGLERCIQFLRVGGRLGIVLPDGVLANRGALPIREWLERETKIRAVVSLPIETFVPFGANIKTSVVFARKWRQGEERPTDYPVFLARIDDVGYGATGRERNADELATVAGRLLTFLKEEGW